MIGRIVKHLLYRLCHHEGCFVTPTYNYPNEKKRIFCVSHKLDGMVSHSADPW